MARAQAVPPPHRLRPLRPPRAAPPPAPSSGWRSPPPPAGAVGAAGRKYYGETVVPFWFNNLHRFAMYGALVFVPILWWGAIRSFYHDGEIGVGLGSVILAINAYLLMMYTFSCHSLRHWVGGGLDCFSCTKFTRTRKRLWDYVSRWNLSP